MPLHLDYRPDSLENFIGNRSTVQALKNTLAKESRPHSYLFTGDSGCGKTTLARIAASNLGITGFDLKEINCSDKRTLEDAREIIRKARTASLLGNGGNKGWILDEFHLFGEGGNSPKNKPQNALLKILEEPPSHVYFFICSTDPQNILTTIKSRCSTYEVRPLSTKQITELLSKVAGKEIPQEVLEQIAKDSLGRPREALTILEKIIDLPERQMLRAAKQSAQVESQSIELCRALIAGKSWKEVSLILKGLEKEPEESIRRSVLGWASTVLLNDGDPQAYLVLDSFREPFYNSGRAGLTLACYESLEAGE
jgi:DNA polymerase-3 subunit gamma/tau